MLFAAGLAAYFIGAEKRHTENPEDRVMPTIAQMVQGMKDAVLKPAEEDEAPAENATRTEKLTTSMLYKDTKSTVRRFAISMALLIPAVMLGLHMGLFPYVGAFFLRFCLFFDKIVALSLLPILFIAFGIDELSKIMLILIGVAPTIILDTFNLTRAVPNEQLIKVLHTWRERLRRCLSRGPEADTAASSEQHSAQSQGCDVVLVRGRDDCLNRWARLPDRTPSPAHGNGCHHPLRALGRSAAVPCRSRHASINRKLHPWFHEA